MALNYTDVSPGDTILAAHPNALLDDIEQHDHDGTDTSKLNVGVELASAVTRYYVIGIGDCVADEHDTEYQITDNALFNKDAGFASHKYFAGVHLPNGAIVTNLKLYYYQSDAAAVITVDLERNDFAGSGSDLANLADDNQTDGYNNIDTSSISNATIDNTSYWYRLGITINPNDSDSEVAFVGAIITYTVVKPLP